MQHIQSLNEGHVLPNARQSETNFNLPLSGDSNGQDIATKPSSSEDAASLCPICLLDIQTSDKSLTWPCMHAFCKGCLQEAVRYSNKCPNCRTRVKTIINDIVSDSQFTEVVVPARPPLRQRLRAPPTNDEDLFVISEEDLELTMNELESVFVNLGLNRYLQDNPIEEPRRQPEETITTDGIEVAQVMLPTGPPSSRTRSRTRALRQGRNERAPTNQRSNLGIREGRASDRQESTFQRSTFATPRGRQRVYNTRRRRNRRKSQRYNFY